jgi:hypothetical protein
MNEYHKPTTASSVLYLVEPTDSRMPPTSFRINSNVKFHSPIDLHIGTSTHDLNNRVLLYIISLSNEVSTSSSSTHHCQEFLRTNLQKLLASTAIDCHRSSFCINHWPTSNNIPTSLRYSDFHISYSLLHSMSRRNQGRHALPSSHFGIELLFKFRLSCNPRLPVLCLLMEGVKFAVIRITKWLTLYHCFSSFSFLHHNTNTKLSIQIVTVEQQLDYILSFENR